MIEPDLAAAVMLVALVVYALTAGADFGGGIWHLLAFGPSSAAQRRLVDDAIAPIWEANHVWMVLIIVLLFVCFPAAYAATSIALHIPLTVMLFGIVMRGAGFAFRHYAATPTMRRRWSGIFAAASAITPFFLGISVASISAGTIRIAGGTVEGGFIHPWLHPFGLAVGAFTTSLFALLAAVYLVNEATSVDLRREFSRRAVGAGIASGVAAFAALALIPDSAASFRSALLHSWWSVPVHGGTALAGLLCLILISSKPRLARILVMIQITTVLVAWGVAQAPLLVAPSLTIRDAAAPPAVIRATLSALLAGAAVLLPSFLYLFRVFKLRTVPSSDRADLEQV